jgi:ferredoxin
MKLPRIPKTRRLIQWVTAGITVAIGVQFTLWVVPHLDGRWPSVSRPPGVEAFLPIDGMMSLRNLLHTGVIDPIHPAGLAIFIGICLMSVVVAKSFCSHVCPVGLLSELLGRLGIRMTGRTHTPPKWIDIPLRGLKYLLLGFFAWAIWWVMSPQEVAAFIESPYAKIVDAKMWAFFAPPSRLTVAVIGVLVVGSVFIRDLWCRYLCPYGALVGLLGVLAPLKVTRDADLCTDCHECSKVCPARLPVHGMERVASVECTSCQDCVVACPVDGCLAVRPPLEAGRSRCLRPAVASLVAIGIYLAVVGGFRLTGHWQTSITEAEFNERLQEMNSPVYSHVGTRAMTEE